MQERNIISGTTAAFLSPFVDGWQSMIIWLIVALVLVIGDLRFGVMAARKRGETIRYSRAARRTINKLVDYICWISIAWVLGGSFGHIFGVPLLSAIVMLVACVIEMSSIVNNYLEYKGVAKKVNVFKALANLFKRPEIEEILEDTNTTIQVGGQGDDAE